MRVSIPRRSWDRRSLRSPREERVRSPRKFQGPRPSKHWTRYSVHGRDWKGGRNSRATWKHRKRVVRIVTEIQYYLLNLDLLFHINFSQHLFPNSRFSFISLSTPILIKLYIYKIIPTSLPTEYSSIPPPLPPAEHRNSVEKILGRKRKKSGVETATWKRSRSNDRGGGEVDIARCAAVSRWRRRERRLAGFRGCTVGTSPSPCIPIDR